jgi:hypothetical protein
MTKAFLFSTVLLTVVRLCAAQQLPTHQVQLRNSESVPVSFGLSCDDRVTWRAGSLDGSKSQRFACDAASARMWVHISNDVPGSPHRECEIRLEDEKRYEFFFNATESRWDLRQM